MVKFSVLMVTYDGEHEGRLDKCLESIEMQTLRPDETIICLDGEVREDLKNVIKKYMKTIRIKIIQNEKSSLANNLNIGLKNCKYDFVIRCDSDDVSYPIRFEEQIYLLNQFGYDVVSANLIEMFNKKKRIKRIPYGLITKSSFYRYFRNPVNHNVCAFRKKSIKQFMYPSGRMEDFLLWTKVLNKNLKIYNQNKELLIADVNNLGSRRIGKDYRRAEIKLLEINFREADFFGKIFSILAFLVRYPLRFAGLKPVLNFIYTLIRN